MTIGWVNFLCEFLEKNNINFDRNTVIQDLSRSSDSNLISFKSFTDLFDNSSIEYLVASISSDYFDDLSKDFIATINMFNEEIICHVNKNNSGRLVLKSPNRNPYEISIEEFKKIWTGNVLLVDKVKFNWVNEMIKSNSLIIITLSTFLIYGIFNIENTSLVLLVVSVIGGLLGNHIIEISKSQHSKKSALCSTKKVADGCKLIYDKNIKIFGFIPFSILPIAFFSGLSLSLLFGYNISSNLFWYLLLVCPIIFYSIWHQFKNKQFCRICLVVGGLFLILIIFSFLFLPNLSFALSKINVWIIIFPQILSLLVFYQYWKINTQHNKIDELNFKVSKFRSSRKIFQTLLGENKISLVNNIDKEHQISYGQFETENVIDLIINPFCAHCRSHFSKTVKVLDKNFNSIRINIVFNIGEVGKNSQEAIICATILELYQNNKNSALTALTNWFLSPNYDEWTKKNKIEISENSFTSLLAHWNWCRKKNISETPVIIYNNSLFPIQYDINDLNYLI